MRPRTGALSVMVSTHRANRLAALRARRTVSSKDNRAGYVDLHKHPACACFINGSYSKSRARPARRGWGRRGLEKWRISAQTGSLPALCANDYRRLAVLACFCGASSRLSLMPLRCMRAITHLSTSTLLQLRVKRSVIIECRKK